MNTSIRGFAIPLFFVVGCAAAPRDAGDAPSPADDSLAMREEKPAEMGSIEKQLRELYPEWDKLSDDDRAKRAAEFEEKQIRELHPDWDKLDPKEQSELGKAYLGGGGVLIAEIDDGSGAPYPPIQISYDYSYEVDETMTAGSDNTAKHRVVAHRPDVLRGPTRTTPTDVGGRVDCLQLGTTPLIKCGMILVKQPTVAPTPCTQDSQCGPLGVGYCGASRDPGYPGNLAPERCFEKIGPGAMPSSVPQTHTAYASLPDPGSASSFFTLGAMTRQLVAGVPACANVTTNQSPMYCLRVISPGAT